jgi:hypothetical protein
LDQSGRIAAERIHVGRYTHRVAISNNRLVSMDDGKGRHLFAGADFEGKPRRLPDGDEPTDVAEAMLFLLPDAASGVSGVRCCK